MKDDLEKQLEAKIEEWSKLKDEDKKGCGDVPVAAQAELFYRRDLLPLIARKARLRWQQDHGEREPFDVMISLLGFSPATSIIASSVLRPEHLILVTSSDADKGIDIVSAALVPELVAQRNFRHHRCDPTDPLDIYAKTKGSLEEIRTSRKGKPLRAIIDITGGKKVMSAAASLVAWRLDLAHCYVDSDFDPATKDPRPGSERLIFLDNPVNIYREEEYTAVERVFDSGRFALSRESFQRLAGLLSDPIPARFMAALSDVYSAWCDLDLERLAETVDELEVRLPEVRRGGTLSADHDQRLGAQIDFVRRLIDGEPSARLLAFHLLGQHYGQVLKRWDFAALFFYRTIEGCLVQRLREFHPCFTASPVDYAKLDRDWEALLQRYNEIADSLGDGQRESALPARLGLINSAALLLALDDPLLEKAGYGAPGGLGELKSLSEIRNASILAHGTRSVSETDCGKLEKAAIRFLQRSFELCGWRFPGKDTLTSACERLGFIVFSAHRP